MPPPPKTCPKMIPPPKGGSLFVEGVFAKKNFRRGRHSAVVLSEEANHGAHSVLQWCSSNPVATHAPLCFAHPGRVERGSGSGGRGTDMPPAPCSCSVYARPVCRWKDLGPWLKTCQRGSLGDHGPVSGGGLTSQRQDLVFSCLAHLHRRGMRLMEEGGRGKRPDQLL